MYAWNVLSSSLPELLSELKALSLDGIGLVAFAALFAIAGVSKLRRPQFAAVALADFGVTRQVRVWHGTVLGAVEVSFAAALLLAPWPQLALTATCIVLSLFAVALALRVRSGRTEPCFCFGNSSEPISGRTVARTAGLASVAGILGLLAGEARSVDPALLAYQTVVASAIVLGLLLTSSLRSLTAKPAEALGEGAS